RAEEGEVVALRAGERGKEIARDNLHLDAVLPRVRRGGSQRIVGDVGADHAELRKALLHRDSEEPAATADVPERPAAARKRGERLDDLAGAERGRLARHVSPAAVERAVEHLNLDLAARVDGPSR